MAKRNLTQEPAPEIVEEVEAPVEEKKPVVFTGSVSCPRLNVRKNPSTDADVLKVIDQDVRLKLKETEDPEWFAVIPSGFVMSKFIKK